MAPSIKFTWYVIIIMIMMLDKIGPFAIFSSLLVVVILAAKKTLEKGRRFLLLPPNTLETRTDMFNEHET